jgi:hypothetical protein
MACTGNMTAAVHLGSRLQIGSNGEFSIATCRVHARHTGSSMEHCAVGRGAFIVAENAVR